MRSPRFFARTVLCAAAAFILLAGGNLWAKVSVNAVSGEQEFAALNKVDVENQTIVFDTTTIKWADIMEMKLYEPVAPPETGYRIYFRDGSFIHGQVLGGRVEGANLYIKVKSDFTDNKEVEFNTGAVGAVQNLDMNLYRLSALNRLKAMANNAPFGVTNFGGARVSAKELQELYDADPTKFDGEAKTMLTTKTADFQAYITNPIRQKSDFYYGTEENEVELPGTVDNLDNSLNIEFAGAKKVSGNLSKILGLSFKLLARPQGYAERPYVKLRGTQGETVTGEIVASSAGTITVKNDLVTKSKADAPETVQFEIPIPRISYAEFYNGSFVYLSDLPASDVTAVEYGDVEDAGKTTSDLFAMQRDHSTLPGRPALKLGGKTYRKGIGCHSHSELTFNVGGKYKRFKALLGIDEGIPEYGRTITDVDVEIRCDGKVVYSKKGLKYGDVQKIDVDLTGVKTFTLLVDFGQNQHFHDHTDWANAILVK